MSSNLPFDRSRSDSFSIPDLVSMAESGALRVPWFQRAFAWNANDVRSLFDSIYRGFPLGTLLLWRRRADDGRVRFGPVEIDVPKLTDAYWVVDGQQRITSLFVALSQIISTDDARFNVYFDLTTRTFFTPKRGVPPRAVPVRETLETRSLLHWMRQHGDDLEPEDFDTLESLGGSLRDYRIPAYIVSGDDQILLRDVFDRVNTAGKPISRAQAFHALFASSSESASPMAVAQELQIEGFGTLEENRVVQSLLAIRGGDVQRDIHDEFGPGEDPEEWYDQTTAALARVISFLREEGVPHLLLAPNTLPIPVLATFFHLHPEPQHWTRRLLARWLWRGWVHGFGREGGQTPVLRRAVRSVFPRTGEPDQAPDEYDAVKALLDFTPDRSAPELSLENFKTNYANSRLILLALTSLRPLDLDGSALELAQEFELHGAAAVTELVPRHKGNAAARSFWPFERSAGEISLASEEVRASHLVSDEVADLINLDRPEELLRVRSWSLSALTTAFLEERLESGALVRRSLTDLVARGSDASHD